MSTPLSAPPPAGPATDERTWAMSAHLLGILTSVIGLGFVGPLVVWAIKKDESAFVADQAKESLNFQITLVIICAVLLAATLFTCGIGGLVAIPLLVVLNVANLVLCILAGVAANEGKYYRYPFAWRLVQ